MATRKQSKFNEINIQYCQYCGREGKNLNSLMTHQRLCKNNPNKKVSSFTIYHQNFPSSWNKGLTKETDSRVAKISKTYHENFLAGKHKSNSHKHTQETKNYLRENALKNNWEEHFGSHKSYTYNGVKFISSYEVELAKNLDLNNIDWIKPSRLTYIDSNGKKHHYTADFYLPEYNLYLDPKNDYLIEHINPTLGYSDKQKIAWVEEQNNVKVLILNKSQLSWDYIKSYMRSWGSGSLTDC